MVASSRKRRHPHISLVDEGPDQLQRRTLRPTTAPTVNLAASEIIEEPRRPIPPLISEKATLPPQTPRTSKRRQVASDYSEKYLARRPAILEECLRHYGRSPSLLCNRCGEPREPLTRCRDCFRAPELCSSCQVGVHTHIPFHWVDVWTGSFFGRHSLSKLGLLIQLGHSGLACPHAGSSPSLSFVVVHANGIHNVSLSFCGCVGRAERYIQLLQAQLFPVTFNSPKTAFTFSVLKDFHLHTLCSKKSAYDYFAKLVRQTNDILPSAANDRYRELLRVSRVWMDLENCRCSGQAHGLGRWLPSYAGSRIRSPLCPACPQPGVNVTLQELRASDPAKPHLVALYLGGDGNFSLSAKKKAIDPDDVPLNDGEGFFPNLGQFEKYILSNEDFKLPQTCSGFKTSMLFQGSLGCRSSGVYSWSCLRHSLYRPGGTVDLQVGERFSNVDYAFAGAITGAESLPVLFLSYDLACMWSPRWRERMGARFPHLVSLWDRITFVVPKMHEYAHREKCRYSFSLSWKKGAAQVDGEGVERTWAEHNQLGGSTKEMNPGHQRDCLESHFTDWNWKKQRDIVPHLCRRMLSAKTLLEQCAAHYDALSSTFGPHCVQQWRSHEEYVEQSDGTFRSAYRFPDSTLPSQQQVVDSMRDEEHAVERLMMIVSDSVDRVSSVTFIQLGVTLQEHQLLVQKKIEGLEEARGDACTPREIEDLRATLLPQLETWRVLQLREMPCLSTGNLLCLLDGSNGSEPEREPLGLPSSFDLQARRALKLEHLGSIELTLRMAQADEAISRMVEALKVQQVYREKVRSSASASGMKTRARTTMQLQATIVKRYADTYRRARIAMLSLGLSCDHDKYRDLLDTDLLLGPFGIGDRLSGRSRPQPWFHALRVSSMPRDEHVRASWSEAVDAVTWWRAFAAWQRAQEEVELLEAEMRRAIRFFEFYRAVWNVAADEKNYGTDNTGWAAYALKQAEVFSLMAGQARASFSIFLKTNHICTS